MAIDQSSTPATGARGRRQFPDGFHHDAQEELLRGAAPVTTRPYLPSSSPTRRPTNAASNGGRRRRHPRKDANPNANYYGVLADEEDEFADAFDALDLETETRKIITKEKERMTTRADVLRTFAESIAACARKFDHGYAHAVANDFTRSLLRHWNQFLHSGEAAGFSNEMPQPKLQSAQKPLTKLPTDNQTARRKTVSFADVTKAAAQQAPGDVHIAPARRQPIATNNYTDRRILLRLKEGSSFFEKNNFQIRLALKEKLALDPQDIQDIKPTNTGWALLARNGEIQRKIIESQGVWGPSMDLDTAEKHVEWHTYLIKDFPSELRSYDDSILDFEKTIGEEIIAQTGQTPVQWRRSSKPSPDPTKTTLIISFDRPVRGNFRLLGLGAYSFLLTKPKRLVQCQNCWQFHPPVRCTATKTCRTCGVTDSHHDTEGCQATPKCTNCYGPHRADYEQCYARPRKDGGTFRKLSKSQRIHARNLGADDYRRQNMENLIQPPEHTSPQDDETATTNDQHADDAEMVNVPERDDTPPRQEDHQPAAGEDDEMEDPETDRMHSNCGAPEEEETLEEARTKSIEADHDSREQADERNDITEDPQDAQEAETEDDANTGNRENEEENVEEGSDESEDESNDGGDDQSNDESNGETADVADDTPEREETQEGQKDGNEVLATHKVNGVLPHTFPPRTATRIVEGFRRDPSRVPSSKPFPLKKRYISTRAAQQIIPSETTNPSSDAATGHEIRVRSSPPQHSPPSSPPQAARLTIKIFQANVDKGEENHSAALQLAFLEGFNVVILQEPSTSYNNKKQLCRTQPEVESTLEVLEDWTPPENCVVAGDMNASHASWQSDRPASQDGNRIYEWMERHDLQLLNEPNEATTMAKRYTRGSTIDLAFSNIPEAMATVEIHLTTGSLHYTIGIEIPNQEPIQVTRGKVRVTTPDEIRAFGKHVGKAVKSLPSDLDSEAAIENMARQLQEILQNSARACGRVSGGRRAQSYPWWNQECKDAHDDLRITRRIYENQRGEEIQRARLRFCRVLRRTRQSFWRNTINEVTTAEGVYKLTRWMKPRQRLQPPPIQVGGMTYSTEMEKAMVLRKEKLERRDASDDIPDAWQPTVDPAKGIPFAETISTKEIEKAVLRTGNTTPGSDGITTKMLQAAWSHIARPLTTLYNACLRLG
ncbi:hypothetical protein ARSEF4850_008810, partial [Beauveria asiatica]